MHEIRQLERQAINEANGLPAGVVRNRVREIEGRFDCLPTNVAVGAVTRNTLGCFFVKSFGRRKKTPPRAAGRFG